MHKNELNNQLPKRKTKPRVKEIEGNARLLLVLIIIQLTRDKILCAMTIAGAASVQRIWKI